MVLLLAVFATLAVFYRAEISEIIQVVLEWVHDHKFAGPVILVFAQMMVTVLFIPGSLLAVGTGWVFKQVYTNFWLAILVGTTSVWLGA